MKENQKIKLSFFKIVNYLCSRNVLKGDEALHRAKRIYLLLSNKKNIITKKDKTYLKSLIEVYLFFREIERKKR